jgi:hypothetical protein
LATVEGSNPTARRLDAGAVNALVDLLGGDAEGLAELVAAFLEEAPARIARRGH